MWTAFSINVAALITGLLLSISFGEINWIFALCFGLAALITTLTVRLSGLFITVASQPFLFGLFVPITAWFIARSNLSGGADQWSKTMILSALYPLAQFFPALAAITAVAIAIAVWRWRGAKKRYLNDLQLLERQRKSEARSERQNRQTATRVRQISRRPRRREDSEGERIPFTELIKDVNSRADQRRAERGQQRPTQRMTPRTPGADRDRSARRPGVEKPAPSRAVKPEQKPARRSLSDDLYS
ncbi:hypothetical protein CKALI_07865 [Corynebacterium kalinowskii]|uniref:DUF6542 domain-containing protein n=1 Tax=Corynebacterium kalinowskii TaxID=2675216 RepID=A0A6B8VU18_9CORY|nr:hypothetical protein CKALI_07865 [Corynebacterium kalinowskii]